MWGHTARTATPPVPVASHATSVASYTPVCPTMSGGARLHMTNGYLPLFMASTIWVGGRGVFGCVNKLAPSLVLVHSRDGDGSHPSSLPCARSLKGWRRQPPLIPCSPYSTSRCGWSGGVAALTASATPPTLISGCRSYVATLGEGTSCLSSRSNAASQPPLKKKVTWAYFSVSKGGQTRRVIAGSMTGLDAEPVH